MMEKERGDSFSLLTRGRDINWDEIRKDLISPNRQVGPGGNSSKPSFGLSSSNK
jgi:hypothetical protein